MFQDELLDRLDSLVQKAQGDIEKLEPGSQERSRAVNDLNIILDARDRYKKNVEARMDKEHDDYVSFKKDEENKVLEKEKEKREKRDRIWKRVLDCFQIGITAITSILTVIFVWFGLKMEYNNGNPMGFTLKNCLRDLTHKK